MLDSLRSTSILVCLALIMTASAGCFADDADPASADGTGTSPTTTQANATAGSSANASNNDPVLEVTILFNGTGLTQENGSYAVAVGDNLTFDASNSTDADGDELTFNWDFGDGNTSQEAAPVYAFGAAGNYTVNVTADDGNGGSATMALNVTVGSAGPAPGSVIREEKKTYTGTYTAGVQAGFPCVANVQGASASKANEFVVPATEAGADVGVSKLVITLTGGTTTVDQAFRLVDPTGKATDVDAASDNGETLTLEGELPAGKYTITVYGCAAVNGSWTLVVTGTLVAI